MSILNHVRFALIGTALVSTVWSSNAFANITPEHLQAPRDFGFTHIEKIEYEGNGRIEVDGWGDDGWYLEVEFQGDQVLEEKRQRTIVSPWGVTFDQLEQLLEIAEARGMQRVDEIEIEDDGRIEIEGRGSNGRKMEIKIALSELE